VVLMQPYFVLLGVPCQGIDIRRALPSVEHFVSCHPDSTLHKCSRILC
jgi:hypothetical protein